MFHITTFKINLSCICLIDSIESSIHEEIYLEDNLEQNNLLTMQFYIDQMSLEIQSRGRSIAELQIAGVKSTFSKRGVEMSITFTVHSLLLVDALQTFGADFELLVASHKHVGMDSMSGSIRDSEPTSPISPASPDSYSSKNGATSPTALTQVCYIVNCLLFFVINVISLGLVTMSNL